MSAWSKIMLLSTLPILTAISTIQAHTLSPYILPDVFDAEMNTVSFQSAVTLEKFFTPTGNFATRYVVTDPNGQTVTIEPAAKLTRFSLAEFPVQAEGTYRIQTLDAVGMPAKYALIDQKWLRVRPMRPTPPNDKQNDKPKAAESQKMSVEQRPRFITEADLTPKTETFTVTNHYLAESFVSKGKPSVIPAINNKGLELKLLSHPNELYAGDDLKAVVFFNGQAVPNVNVEIFKGKSSYQKNAQNEQPHQTSNAKGEINIPFQQAGIYVVTINYPVPNVDNSKKPAAESYTYGLTVEVNE